MGRQVARINLYMALTTLFEPRFLWSWNILTRSKIVDRLFQIFSTVGQLGEGVKLTPGISCPVSMCFFLKDFFMMVL